EYKTATQRRRPDAPPIPPLSTLFACLAAAPRAGTGIIPTEPSKGHAMATLTSTDRYARVIETSKRVRWDIERDVIRGRRFDYTKTFMPSGLSLVNELPFLSSPDKRLLSQVQ